MTENTYLPPPVVEDRYTTTAAVSVAAPQVDPIIAVVDSIHPPNFVTLSARREIYNSDDSPLSSQANSPNASFRASGHLDLDDDDDDDDNDNGNNEVNRSSSNIRMDNIDADEGLGRLDSERIVEDAINNNNNNNNVLANKMDNGTNPQTPDINAFFELPSPSSNAHPTPFDEPTRNGLLLRRPLHRHSTEMLRKENRRFEQQEQQTHSNHDCDVDQTDNQNDKTNLLLGSGSSSALEDIDTDVPDDEKKLDDTTDAFYRSSFDQSILGQHDDDMNEPPSLSSSRQEQQQLNNWRSTSSNRQHEKVEELNSMTTVANSQRWHSRTTTTTTTTTNKNNNNSNTTTTSSRSSPAPASSEEPPSLSIAVDEAKNRFLNRPQLSMMGRDRALTTGSIAAIHHKSDASDNNNNNDNLSQAEKIGRHQDVNSSNKRTTTKSWMDLMNTGTRNDVIISDNHVAASTSITPRGSKSFGDVTKLRTSYQQHHKSGSGTRSSGTTGGIEREQHLRFAALKREIVSTTKRGLNNFDTTLMNETTSTTQMTTKTTTVTAVATTTTKTTSGTSTVDDQNRDGSKIEESPESSNADGAATTTTGAGEVPSSSTSAAESGMQPAILSPDGDMDMMEFSVMVSPDGEIDYSKPIINLLSSPLGATTSVRTSTVADDTEVGACGRDKRESLILPNLISREQYPSTIANDNVGPERSNLTGNQPSIECTSANVAPSAGIEQHAEQDFLSLGPTQSHSSLEGGETLYHDFSPSKSASSYYTPPDRAWGDYLTFRGVAVNSSPLGKKSAPTSEGANRTSDISIIGVIGSVFNTAETTGGGPSDTEIPTVEGEKNSIQNKPYKAPYREMTPKKDLQGSDKGNAWLQEELRRRSYVKQEINNAILAVGRETNRLESFSPTYKNRTDSIDVTTSNSFESGHEDSNSVLDDELVVINANEGSPDRDDVAGNSFDQPSTDGRVPGNDSMDDPNSIVLDFVDCEEASVFEETDIAAELLVVSDSVADLRDEMRNFASATRAALRDQSLADIASPLAINRSTKDEEKSIDRLPKPVQVSKSTSGSRGQYSESTGTEFADLLSNDPPVMIGSMDCFEGIAKGDITLSLLNENTGTTAMPAAATWANRVYVAIWRSRRMRRNMMHVQEIYLRQPPGSPARGRSSLPVDLDKARVAGGIRTVESTQAAALRHLEHDEIEEAIELYEDIIFAYYSYFERSLNMRETTTAQSGIGSIDFKPYIGMALHNLGVLNLLKGEYHEGLAFFTRAAESRKSHFGEEHPDHVSSLVKVAICRFAINEFAEAHARLEEALFYAKKSSNSLEGRVQMAEILNNLGCLAYMCGQPTAANSFFRHSMDVQFGSLTDSLYGGNSTLGQSISMNISITRANIGFVKLVTKDLPVAITALENALMEQQILLKGAHETMVATMDHLAVSNLLYGDLEKAALMFHRILEVQQSEYGPLDRRCFVTADKISMVQGKGIQYEKALEELHKTFSLPERTEPKNQPQSKGDSMSSSSKKSGKVSRGNKSNKGRQALDATQTRQAKGNNNMNQTNKVLKALSSMMKKKP